jgi:hypothetical protein
MIKYLSHLFLKAYRKEKKVNAPLKERARINAIIVKKPPPLKNSKTEKIFAKAQIIDKKTATKSLHKTIIMIFYI